MVDLKIRIKVDREELALSPRSILKRMSTLLFIKEPLEERISKFFKGKEKRGLTAKVEYGGNEDSYISLISSSVIGYKNEWILHSAESTTSVPIVNSLLF